LPVTFRDASNYRIEALTFEVVDFSRSYHVILGRPCYIKFKIPGLANIITVEAKAQWALDYEHNDIELAATAVTIIELKELCLNAPPSLANPAMPTMSVTFKATEDANAIQIDIEDPTKTVHTGAGLSPK
jgi:hypothetical protein